MKKLLDITKLISFILLVSCTKAPDEILVSSVSINQVAAEMIIGETVQLSATVLPSNATEKSVIWSSSKQSVATISGSGLVTAIAEGNSTITASCGGKSATCQVIVSKGYIAVTSVTLNKTELTLEKGKTETLIATVNPSDATEKTVTWSSSNKDIASVDTNGKITAVGGGSAIITAKAGNQQTTCNVIVTVPVESVTLDKESITLEEESSTTLVATVKPDDATDKKVTWVSSNEQIATVDETGKVCAIKEGEAIITAKAEEKKAECKVVVQKKVIPVSSISLNKANLSLVKGATETLIATVKPDDATDKTVTWSSSDDKVVTVDKDGKVTAIAGGSTKITAKAGEKETSCVVTVTVPVASVTLDQNSLTLEEEQTATLVATVLPEDATDKTVTWSSSDEAVAKVENGVVTAIKEGKATIMAKAGEKEGKCEVTVKRNPANEPIQFADANVKAKLVAAFDTDKDGELSYAEAAAITSSYAIQDAFGGNNNYKSFEEFQFFTGITEVCNSMFSDWLALTSIAIPIGVTNIEYAAFNNCYRLTSITIPEGVTRIGDRCFSMCSKLASVSLPLSLTNIGQHAFYQCASLTSINIPEGVTIIASSAFYECSSLASITIPEGVTTIGDYAFSGCSSLASVTIPENVVLIGRAAFFSCSGLSSITVKAMEPPLGDMLIFHGTSECPIFVPAESVDAYKNAAGWSDYSDRIQAMPLQGIITFADLNLKAKLVSAFDINGDGELSYEEAANVKSPIDIVNSIGSFKSFDSFDEFKFFSGIPSVTDRMFAGWTIKSIVLPEGIKSIGEGAFDNCSQLESITLNEGLKTISTLAFRDCRKLDKITIPKSLQALGYAVFYNCSSISNIEIPNGNIGVMTFENCVSLITVTIRDAKDGYDISRNAFRDCKKLEYINMPTGTRKIWDYAFANCSSLKSSIKLDKVESICESAFSNCTSLTSIDISVREVDEWYLTRCGIGKKAFYGCTNLKTAIIDGYYISSDSFFGCTNLKTVSLSERLSGISARAFACCSSIEQLIIPQSVSSIGDSAFLSCSSLTSIIINSLTPPEAEEDIFKDTNNCPIYVPAASVNAYKTAEHWKEYADRIQAIKE